VAYLSPDLRAHPVGYILRGVLEAHDPARVAPSIWNLFPGRDWLSDEYRDSGLVFHEVTGLSDDALAEALRSADIDVLVDLAGHTAHNRLGVLARRPARLQVHFLGWFAALGVPGLDAILMGADQLPEGHAAHFTEPVRALPGCHFRYRRLPHAPEPPREDPPEPLRFASFNNTAKLTPEVLDTWADILHAVPGSVLELRWKTIGDPSIRAGLERRFASAGIGPERLALHGACPHDELLAAYRRIHIALDPFPFSGGMTTLEALSMGVPVVTLAQHRPVSRQGHGMLRALGLEALSTDTVRDYIATASALAHDAERRHAIRRRLVDEFDSSPLADAAGLAGQLEDAYEALMASREGA
jgi:predicted O-linked N-acetylglucosamine transferase (SPINDLY family)